MRLRSAAFALLLAGCGGGSEAPAPQTPPSAETQALAANSARLLWGAIYPNSVRIHSQMLPSPHFAEAIQNIPYGTPVADMMGDYTPQIRYCDRATIEQATSAADAFVRCAPGR